MSTKVSESFTFSRSANKIIACPGDFIQITPDRSLFGNWFYEKNGSGIEKPIGQSQNLGVNSPVALEGFGEYSISLCVDNPDIPGCVISSSLDIKFNPSPSYEFSIADPASGCSAPDGALTITALTDLDQLYYVIDPLTVSPSVSL